MHVVTISGSDEEINGEWMIGATGGESSYSNSKRDMIHKIMLLTAIALVTENGDTVIPAIGCPLSDFEDGDRKTDLYEYLIPDGRVDITVDGVSRYYYVEKNKGLIFPESFGALCKKLGIKISREEIKGTHSFRRNAITDVVNESGGNLILAAELFGNSPEIAKKNYYTGINKEEALRVLNRRKFS